VGRTAEGLLERFGPERVIDTPVSENAMTGAAVGVALAGMRSVVVHPRMDFMFYAFDPIINQAAPTPASGPLEKAYYPTVENIFSVIEKICR